MANPAPAPAGRLYYRGDVDYAELDGVNISTLKELRRSAKRYQYRLRNRSEPTASMEFGTATHVAILEPERFLREFALWQSEGDDGKTRQRRGKAWDAFKAANDGKTIIRDAEYDEAIVLSRAVRDDPLAMKYLAMGRHEVAASWTDAHTGVSCKGRVDWLTKVDGASVIVDVKTTRCVEPWSFSKDVAKFGYHLQCAFYADGFEAATGVAPEFRVVAVESDAPYDVVVYRVPPDVLDIGRDEYRRLLEILVDCRQRDYWPGVGDGVEQDLALPAWAVPDDSDSLDDLKGWK
jgi:hypothetical protein